MADWFKFYENDLDEMRLQWAIGEMPEVLNVWMVLLSEACRHKDGTLSGYSQDFELFGISKRINVTTPKVNSSIELLIKIKYLERQKDGSLLIRKWEERQSEYCQKKTRLQNQDGENHWTKQNRTKNSDSVGTVSGQHPDSVRQEERRGDKKRIESPMFPKSLESPEFRSKWNEWEQHRRELKKPLTPTSMAQQLKKMERWGLEKSLSIMDEAIANGWQGLFEPKINGFKKQKTDPCI